MKLSSNPWVDFLLVDGHTKYNHDEGIHGNTVYHMLGLTKEKIKKQIIEYNNNKSSK